MILMYPFEDKKEKIRVSSDFSLNGNNFVVSYLIDDRESTLEDFYPFESDKEVAGQLFPLENLWTTTCFEIFLKNVNAKDYYEFNFNSKGDWNLFYFSDYRQRVDGYRSSIDLNMVIQAKGDQTQLSFKIDFKKLEKLKLPCVVNMATVIKTKAGVSYWSQKHSGVKADFHDFKNFSLKL